MDLFKLFGVIAINSSEANEDLDKVSDKAKKTGEDIKDTGDEATKTEGKFKGAMSKMAKLAATAGKAIGVGLAAAAGGAIAAGKKLFSLANETAKAGDEIDKTSQKLGMSAEAYQEWDYILGQSGVEITSMTAGLKTLTNQIDDAKNGSDKATERFSKLGISMEDLSTMSREDIFAKVVEGMQSMADSTDRAALANDLFGRSGQELTPLFNSTAESTAALKQTAHDLGFVMSDEAVKSSANFSDSLDTLKRTISGVKNKITADMLPGITQIMSGLSELIAGNENAEEKIKNGVSNVIKAFGSMVTKITPVITAIASTLLEGAPSIISALAEGIISAIPNLMPATMQVVTDLVGTLVELLPQITDAGVQILVTLIQGIAQVAPTLIPQIVDAMLSALLTLLDNAPQLIEVALALIIGLAEGIENALPTLIAAVPKIISSIVSALMRLMPQLYPAAIDIIFALINGLLGALPELIAWIPNIILGIVQGLLDNLPTLILYVPQIITSIITGLIGAIPQLIEAVPKIILSIVDTFKDYDWKSVGTNIMEGLRDGVSAMINKIKEKFREVVESIKDTFKKLLGINSPSTVFAGFGKNLLEGLWNGIANIKEWLIGKIKGLGSTITSAFKSVFGIHSPSTVFENEIGKNLGLGVGVGFEKAMETVKDDMADAIPTDFDIAANVTAMQTVKRSAQDLSPVNPYDVVPGSPIAAVQTGFEVKMSTLDQKFEVLISLLNVFLPGIIEEMKNQIMVLDDGTLVAKIAPEMDKQLGIIYRRKVRS